MSAYGDIAAMATLLRQGSGRHRVTRAVGAPFNPGAPARGQGRRRRHPRSQAREEGRKGDLGRLRAVDDFDDDSSEEGEDGSGLRIPTYEFMYKQAINTADAFLGMAHNKDPARARARTWS